jgi:hypothetical protein
MDPWIGRGVADTYFAMVAVPSRKTEGVEYRTTAYEPQANRTYSGKAILNYRNRSDSADGSRTIIYSGPKDHELLTQASKEVGGLVQRPVDLDGLIDYGYLGWISRPLAVPILQAITVPVPNYR